LLRDNKEAVGKGTGDGKSKAGNQGDRRDAEVTKHSSQDHSDRKANTRDMRRAVAGGGEGRPGREQMRTAMLKRFDKDDDGKLSDEERAAARTAYEARRGSGSGKRGPRGGAPGAERERPDRERMRAEMLKRFDKDGDGRLSDEERATMRKHFEARRGGRGGPGRGGDRGQRGREARESDQSKSDDAKSDEGKESSSDAPASSGETGEKPGSE